MIPSFENDYGNSDFYFNALLRYVRSGKQENYDEKVWFISKEKNNFLEISTFKVGFYIETMSKWNM